MRLAEAPLVAALVAASLLFAGSVSAEDAPEKTSAPARRPNVLWVVWDTTRADHLSLYGYHKATTPHLDEWARGGRVFDDTVSPASSTVPSHASMFTGLLPTEHGVKSSEGWLDDRFTTIAELFRDAGYATYLYASNPNVSRELNFEQGFSRADHPWEPALAKQAERIMAEKRSPDGEQRGAARVKRNRREWNVASTGSLAQDRVKAFIAGVKPGQPWFVFVNYMEAHDPLLPEKKHRESMMSPEQVRASYEDGDELIRRWMHILGLNPYSPEEADLLRARYDAAVHELDELFHDLLATLAEAGDLDDTIIVLTADHGEHLADHDLVGHHYSLHGELTRVPLILYYPKRVPAGRESRPVMNMDLYPTLLALAGIEIPPGSTHTRNLLDPDPERPRLSEYLSVEELPLKFAKGLDPKFDDSRWRRSFRAYQEGSLKFIWASDGKNELFDRSRDPQELHDLSAKEPGEAGELAKQLDGFVQGLKPVLPSAAGQPAMPDEHKRRLEALGYLAPSNESTSEPPGESPSTRATQSSNEPTIQPSAKPSTQPTSKPPRAPESTPAPGKGG